MPRIKKQKRTSEKIRLPRHFQEDDGNHRFVKLMFSGVLVTLFMLGLAALGYGAWSRIKSEVLHSDNYRFSPDRIFITELPSWVPETLLHDVLTNASLHDRETVLTPGLLNDVASAFSSHPWVEEVCQVRLEYPAMVHVDLKYREAVCFIKLPRIQENRNGSGDGADEPKHYYPVDRKGVYLPTDYFLENADSLDRFIKIDNIMSMPTRAVGHPWGDPAVEQGAAIAAILRDVNHLMKIETIRPERKTDGKTLRIVFQLFTANKTKIIWGERLNEQDDLRKKEKLLELVRSSGSLDHVPGIIDLT